jgi:hypothetical protein
MVAIRLAFSAQASRDLRAIKTIKAKGRMETVYRQITMLK